LILIILNRNNWQICNKILTGAQRLYALKNRSIWRILREAQNSERRIFGAKRQKF